MNDNNRLLKIVFVILLLAIIAEVVYFFNLPKNQPEVNVEIPANIPEPTIGFSGPNFKELPPAFNIATLDSYSSIPSYPNTKTTVVIESKNKVVEVDTKKKTIDNQDIVFGIKFSYTPQIERWVWFASSDVSKMKIYYDEFGGGIKKPASLTDIKKDDEILLITKTNPFYSPSDPRHLVEIELNIIR